MTHQHGYETRAWTADGTPGCRTPDHTASMHRQEKGGPMALSRSFPAAKGRWEAALPISGTTTASILVLRWQVLKIIAEVFDDPTTTPEVCKALLQRLQQNAGRPELALLAHLRDYQDEAGPHV